MQSEVKRKEFVELFEGKAGDSFVIDNDFETKLKNDGLDGNIKNTNIRSFYWKFFLGVFKSENDYINNNNKTTTLKDIKKILEKKRNEYKKLKDTLIFNPHDKMNDEKNMDLAVNNPLSQDSDSIWNVYFHNEQMQKEIMQDITRCYPDNEFFMQQHVRDMMLHILFIYAKQNERVLYKQGMHELLAPMIYVLENDKIKVDSSSDNGNGNGGDDYFNFFFDEKFVENDAYAMFVCLMETAQDWFITFNSKAPMSKSSSVDSVGSEDISTAADDEKSPVVRKCHKIHHLLLKQKDFELYRSLEKLNIEPQLYALRWVRLLFGREFHLADILPLWDSLFADGLQNSLLDYVCVAMLIYIRGHVVGKEYTDVMRRLFKYPPVEDPHVFINKARQLRDPKLILTSNANVTMTPIEEQDFPLHENNHHGSSNSNSSNSGGGGSSAISARSGGIPPQRRPVSSATSSSQKNHQSTISAISGRTSSIGKAVGEKAKDIVKTINQNIASTSHTSHSSSISHTPTSFSTYNTTSNNTNNNNSSNSNALATANALTQQLKAENEQLRTTQKLMAERLNAFIDSFQTKVLLLSASQKNPSSSSSSVKEKEKEEEEEEKEEGKESASEQKFTADDLLIAVAEMKQIRDILSQDIAAEIIEHNNNNNNNNSYSSSLVSSSSSTSSSQQQQQQQQPKSGSMDPLGLLVL